MASQSSLDCSDATGLVNSIYRDILSANLLKNISLLVIDFHRSRYNRVCESYIVNAEIIQRLSNLNFLSSVEEGVSKLLALSQSTLNDFEGADVAEEVGNWLVRIPGINWRTRPPGLGVNSCELTCGVESLVLL